MARLMPVLPLVGSSRTLSGVSFPHCSASSIMVRAMRSLTLPVGLWPSSLAKRRTPARGLKPFSSTSGVWPIASTRLANSMSRCSCRGRACPAHGAQQAAPLRGAAGNGGQDRDDVGAADRRGQVAEVANVFVVHIDVDELAKGPIRVEQSASKAGEAPSNVVQHLANVGPLAVDDLRALGMGSQRRGDADLYHAYFSRPGPGPVILRSRPLGHRTAPRSQPVR